jgi:hypothetical protein
VFAEPEAATRTPVKHYGVGNFEDSYFEPEHPADPAQPEQHAPLRVSELTVVFPSDPFDPLQPFDTPLIALKGGAAGSSQQSSAPITLVPIGNAPTLRRLTFSEG